jgi:hypothetical protein
MILLFAKSKMVIAAPGLLVVSPHSHIPSPKRKEGRK